MLGPLSVNLKMANWLVSDTLPLSDAALLLTASVPEPLRTSYAEAIVASVPSWVVSRSAFTLPVVPSAAVEG